MESPKGCMLYQVVGREVLCAFVCIIKNNNHLVGGELEETLLSDSLPLVLSLYNKPEG